MDVEIGDIANWLMGIARTLILAAGGGIGLIKVVKGKTDENPRDFNEGLIILGGAGALVAASFAVEAVFK